MTEPLPQPSQHSPAGNEAYHVPVLLQETVAGLAVRPDGVYVDCTFGGGGHSRAILSQLGAKGRLIAFDQDPDARNNLPEDARITFVPHNFRHLTRFLKLYGITQVDGVLADLGVSSHQFDEPERGFSTRFNGPLDMRMDPAAELTAAKVVQTYSQEQLHRLFEQYGEVTNSKTLAATLVAQRNLQPMHTIEQFRQVIRPVVKGNPHKYLAQVFQALRIEVNAELDALKELLQQLPIVLKPGARAAIITFHSLEDRLVKNFFKKGSFEEEVFNPFATGAPEQVFRIITRKPVEPGREEQQRNPRSRSARLRIAEKI